MLRAHARFRAAQAKRTARRWRAHRRTRPGQLAAFGARSLLLAPARINGPRHIRIGADVLISANAFLSVVDELHGVKYSPRLTIGDRCVFGEQFFVACCGEITIGNDVLASERVFVTDTYHDYADPTKPPLWQPLAPPKPVTIEDGVFLGVGCFILPGVTLGERAYIGAGAVVTKDVPARAIVAGNPALIVKQL